MKSQQQIIDVRKVIEESTQVKTLRELEREGRKAVKVVRASRINELIQRAVENVISEPSARVVEEDKSALVRAAGAEFRRLLQDADQERRKSERRREKFSDYEKEILVLKHKLELSERTHAEDARLLGEQKKVVDELRERVKSLQAELEGFLRRHEEGGVPAGEGGGAGEVIGKIEGVIASKMDEIAKQVAAQFRYLPTGMAKEPVEAAKIVLDSLFKEQARVESNLGKLQVKSAEGTGIARNLRRLKELHRKGFGTRGDDPKAAE